MTEPELQQILAALDAALRVFDAHSGRLEAREVSARSMLVVLRREVVESLARTRKAAERPSE